ncbi:MAG TPA: hypothetical protein VNJ51_00225 [Candidatus Dormibacteraeota bacterium]|nr:hypothetical protein [Candidatus Dormibacteraeota bacterium]
MEMLVASLVSFAALVVAWMILPAVPRAQKGHQSVAGISSDLAA